MDRLTSSPYISNIYGFCANTNFVEYANGGDLRDFLYSHTDLNSTESLKIALDVMTGMADLHNSEKEGVAAIAHTDISQYQWLRRADGIFQLVNFDFNSLCAVDMNLIDAIIHTFVPLYRMISIDVDSSHGIKKRTNHVPLP